MVAAWAVYFDRRQVPLDVIRRRVLALWDPAATVRQGAEGFLISWRTPRPIDCRRAPGTPLTAAGRFLVGAPLERDELAALDAPTGSLILVRSGATISVAPADLPAQDPADWIDPGPLSAVPVESLGVPPPLAAEAVPPATEPTRESFAGVLPEDGGVSGLLAALRRAKGPAAAVPDGRTRTAAGSSPPFGLLPRLWRFGVALLAGWRSRGTRQPALAARGAPDDSSLVQRLLARLRAVASRTILFSGLSKLLGRRQAQYLHRMLDMFGEGDLDQALRHAIPLSAVAALKESTSWGLPSPRAHLGLLAPRLGRGPSIGLGAEVFALVRQAYRTAFMRLEREGRIEEAAFTLAQLLNADEEAVAFLEKHGRRQLAAELAEARQLAPGLVVRQWFVAGQIERAVLIARRAGAFADAVLRLEKSDAKAAASLRLLWADTLASAGEYAGAVAVVWPHANLPPEGDWTPLLRVWLDRAILAGGSTTARVLPRKLLLDPASFPAVRAAAEAILHDDAPEGHLARVTLARALIDSARAPGARALARATSRALLEESETRTLSMYPGELRSLLQAGADKALETDMSGLLPGLGPSGPSPRTDAIITVAASDAGTLSPVDVAYFPDGRLLVALAEAGLLLLTRDGRRIAHIDQPVHALVPSDLGDRALVIRGLGSEGLLRLGRLDVQERRVVPWCDARLSAWAPDFDGSLWFAAYGDDVFAVDALSGTFRALWRVGGLGGRVLRMRRSMSWLRFVVGSDGEAATRWSCELPGPTLRSRDDVNALAVADPSGWGSRTEKTTDGIVVVIERADQAGPRTRVELGGAGAAGVHMAHERAILWDDRGRVLLVDPARGELLRDLRL